MRGKWKNRQLLLANAWTTTFLAPCIFIGGCERHPIVSRQKSRKNGPSANIWTLNPTYGRKRRNIPEMNWCWTHTCDFRFIIGTNLVKNYTLKAIGWYAREKFDLVFNLRICLWIIGYDDSIIFNLKTPSNLTKPIFVPGYRYYDNL